MMPISATPTANTAPNIATTYVSTPMSSCVQTLLSTRPWATQKGTQHYHMERTAPFGPTHMPTTLTVSHKDYLNMSLPPTPYYLSAVTKYQRTVRSPTEKKGAQYDRIKQKPIEYNSLLAATSYPTLETPCHPAPASPPPKY